MVKIDLITGLLGAGKTTFIRKYVSFLLSQGSKVCILENDYGAINVDMMLLSDLKSEGVGIEMVAGGCDYDCHKRRFKTKLITMALLGYDRVIVEPSGIFDVDEFFDVLQEDELYDRYEIGSVIAIVDSQLSKDCTKSYRYLLASQLANSSKLVFSKTQHTTDQHIESLISYINQCLKEVNCNKTFELNQNVVKKPWDKLDYNDFKDIMESGYRECGYIKKYNMENIGFEPLFFMNFTADLNLLKEKIDQLWNDENAGQILRIKGFVNHENQWYEINSVAKITKVSPIENGQQILIVIGEHLNKEVITSYFDAQYSSYQVQQDSLEIFKRTGEKHE